MNLFQYSIENIDPLSFPKGEEPKCEVTDRTATTICITPYISIYYATCAHAELSYKAIIPKIAPFLRLVRSSDGIILGTKTAKEEYKQKTTKYLEQLSDICHTQGTEYLTDHRYDMAAIAAMHAISFHKKADNPSHSGSEMIPLLVLLSNAYIGISKSHDYPYSKSFRKDLLTFVQSCLCTMSYILSKDPSISNDVLLKFHLNYGALLLDGCEGEDLNVQENRDNIQRAIQEFSRYAYYCSLESGPETLQACDAYFYLAKSFCALSRLYECTSFLNKVVDIFWNREILPKFIVSIQNTKAIMSQQEANEIIFLSSKEETLQRTLQLLRQIEVSALDITRAELALYALHVVLKVDDVDKSNENILAVARRSVEMFIAEIGEDHDETQKVKIILDLLANHDASYDEAGP